MSSPRLLLVEDNEANRQLAEYLLKKAGFEVVHAPDGNTALALARSQTFDAILLDIQLPGLDGYEVARQLKGDPALQHLPLVALTSYAMPGDRERAMSIGFAGYIEKPIDTTRFVQQVKLFCQKG